MSDPTFPSNVYDPRQADSTASGEPVGIDSWLQPFPLLPAPCPSSHFTPRRALRWEAEGTRGTLLFPIVLTLVVSPVFIYLFFPGEEGGSAVDGTQGLVRGKQ